MTAARRKVPSFLLYGEQSTAPVQSDALHIEDIQSRSRKYLWRIATHRHAQLSQFVLVTGGPATVYLDDRRYEFADRAAVVIPAGTIHSFEFQPETQGHVLTMDLEGLVHAAGAAHQAGIQSLFFAPRAVDLGGDEVLTARAARFLGLLDQEFKQPDAQFTPVNAWLACCALSIFAGFPSGERTPDIRGSGAAHLQQFKLLIEAQFLQHWSVQRCAQELGMSETSLNRLCRRMAGTTAFDLIQQRLALEARRRLVYSTHSVSGIAADLGFADAAYFCRFFRRRSGLSPNDFRRRHGVG